MIEINNRIKYLTNAQVKTFLNHCRKDNIRDYTMFYLCYRFGLRRQEIRILDTTDINLPEKTIYITAVKSGNSRNYKLQKEEFPIIKNYLVWRKKQQVETKSDEKTITNSDKNALFLSNLNRRISVEQLNKLFKKYRKLARIKKEFTLHSLRHSIAIHLLNSGNSQASIDFVQTHLRHKNRRTTEIYAHITPTFAEDIRKKISDSGKLVGS